MKPRTQRQAARHDRILETTRELIARHGYDGLTMRDLASAADVSPMTLYNLYGNKDALVLAAVADLLTITRQRIRETAPEPGYEQIIAAADMQAQQVERTPEYAGAMTRAFLQAPPDHPLVKSLLWATHRNTLESLRAMKEAGQLRDDADISRLARLLTGSPWASMLLWNKGLLPLTQLRRTLRDGLIAVLIAHATAGTRRMLQERLASEPTDQDLPTTAPRRRQG
jgi:AcrR family transcriptional regulator